MFPLKLRGLPVPQEASPTGIGGLRLPVCYVGGFSASQAFFSGTELCAEVVPLAATSQDPVTDRPILNDQQEER